MNDLKQRVEQTIKVTGSGAYTTRLLAEVWGEMKKNKAIYEGVVNVLENVNKGLRDRIKELEKKPAKTGKTKK